MKDIKFRAWDKIKKIFIDKANFRINGWGDAWEEFRYAGINSFDKNNLIISQFTGLLDKNGTEIYEGDIIHIKSIIDDEEFNLQVEFRLSGFFVGQSGELFLWNRECEVIGNIYENPELLEG